MGESEGDRKYMDAVMKAIATLEKSTAHPIYCGCSDYIGHGPVATECPGAFPIPGGNGSVGLYCEVCTETMKMHGYAPVPIP